MRIFTELLFQHGHIADAALAQRLAEPDAALEPVEQVKPRESHRNVRTGPTDCRRYHAADPRERRMARLSRRLVRERSRHCRHYAETTRPASNETGLDGSASMH